MARNDRNSHSGVDGGLTKEIQKELGLLAVSFEQRAVDCVGFQ